MHTSGAEAVSDEGEGTKEGLGEDMGGGELVAGLVGVLDGEDLGGGGDRGKWKRVAEIDDSGRVIDGMMLLRLL